MTPSKQQAAIYDWVRNGRGNALIVAVAGAGKTTTLIEATALMRGRVALAAYNKKIATEIQAKIEAKQITNAKASTFHAFGYSAWRRVAPKAKVDAKKITDLLRTEKCPSEYEAFITSLVSLARQSCIGVTCSLDHKAAWMEIIDHHDLKQHLADASATYKVWDTETTFTEIPTLDHAIDWAIWILKASIENALEVIDFDDMIYMPLYKNCRMYQYDWVLIDEAQDSNPARRTLARKMLAPGGRLIAVGDPAQAIYGFTGADNDALDIIRQEFGCIDLPLTVSYRCPIAVVDVAREYNAIIEPHESAPRGTVLSGEFEDYFGSEVLHKEEFCGDTAILCRNTNPLIKIAYTLLKADIPCHVEGRDIGASLVKLASRWKRIKNLQLMADKIREYRDSQIVKLMTAKKETQADSVADRCDALLAIIEGMPTSATTDDLRYKIENLFRDSQPGSTLDCTLSTIHKSKGREWETVYWLGRDRYQPSKYARQDWQIDQEFNLMYVAATRSKDRLVLVNAPQQTDQPREDLGV